MKHPVVYGLVAGLGGFAIIFGAAALLSPEPTPSLHNAVQEMMDATHRLAAACYREGYEAGRLVEAGGQTMKPTDGCKP